MNLKLNLNDLWYGDLNSLPEFVWEERCIYRMVNLVNGKNYIGQTRSRLIDRWRLGGFMSHLYGFECDYNDHKYNTIRTYGTKNFEVELIKSNVELDLLDSLEIYWIAKYKSFSPLGYNKNKGGSNNSQLYSPESLAKSIETRRALYDGDCMKPCHLPNIRVIATETNRSNHGGVLAFNTQESIEITNKIRAQYTYDRIKLIIDKAKEDLGEDFIFEGSDVYYQYKVPGAPSYECKKINNFFVNSLRYLDIDYLGKLARHFRYDWLPEELQKYSIGKEVLDDRTLARRTVFRDLIEPMKLTIANALKELDSDFIFSTKLQYQKYYVAGAPEYKSARIIYFFQRCIEFKVPEEEIKSMSIHFIKEWIPEELYKYYTNYDLNYNKSLDTNKEYFHMICKSQAETKLYKSMGFVKTAINKAILDLGDNFVFHTNYWDYREGGPKYEKFHINRFFENCIKYDVSEDDLKFIVPHFRKDWVPQELHKYYNN